MSTAAVRTAIRIRGVVQGVGFRPTAYRVACSLGLGGFVRNERGSVLLEIEGSPERLAQFVDRLQRALPPAARLDSLESVAAAPRGEREFRIEPGAETPVPARGHGAAIGADHGPCDACLRELETPAARRFRYPFITCTGCGPRFTITLRGGPYTRADTTMAPFALCPDCAREYGDPGDRRFHAETNACPACGPQLSYVVHGGPQRSGPDALTAAANALYQGQIVALKGVGGYAFAVDASDERAVARLRARKQRPRKPLAVMARDLAQAERIAQLDPRSRALLTSTARPIVLAPLRPDAPLAASVAPGLSEVGVMLPPSPLQQLLAQAGPQLQVMTSGNLAGEPIAVADFEALTRLAQVADGFLVHDRAISARADDSVLRVIGAHASPVRRARGYVPEEIALPVTAPPLLAVGGEHKNTVCLAFEGRAVLSQHIGDLAQFETFRMFEATIAHLRELTSTVPQAIAHDMHPDYRASRWASSVGLPLIAVQHHHAHVAACLAEHGRTDTALGVVFDGTGYGADGALWGGEILAADLGSCVRLGHLRALALPGGEAAIREPWRVALAALIDAGEPLDLLSRLPAARVQAVRRLIDTGLAAPRATGAGRWFDAVASLCGLCDAISYDGQAALELEAAARGSEPAYPFAIVEAAAAPFEVDLRPVVRAIAADLRRGATAAQVSARFHATLAAAIAESCQRARAVRPLTSVALSGGCFQNRLLALATRAALEAHDFEVLEHRRVPPNDGGLAFGQAAVASQRLARAAQGAL